MGFRSLARFWLLTASIAAAATVPVLAQQSQPAQKPPAAQPAPPAAAPQGSPNAPSPAQQPPGTVKSSHGAWSVICDKPPGAMTDQCALMQNVIAEDQPEIGLSVVVLKTADRKSRILRVLAPLGVLLDTRPPVSGGLGLIVDGENLGNTQFARCFADGCYAEVEIDDNLMKMLRVGSTAVFSIRETGDKDSIGIPVELKGFAEGYDALP
ncbi:invasion associated locus B family protein [Neorhizobium sp. P12A]|uniref:invasion associated locus B family protein n=1 Tax=Rhizobium/Agrobacterium group TaxID=227290 RepID=UPI0010526C19|nr:MULTISPECIES: invasion associated locus B family protein [Rhizobium/Agrobacterium group]KAA0699741.1 invasion associated locus B family protein [Neorhizobium sp. P12A]TCR93452.1 invasion protein IalB [Rhizobium sp. BK376]